MTDARTIIANHLCANIGDDWEELCLDDRERFQIEADAIIAALSTQGLVIVPTKIIAEAFSNGRCETTLDFTGWPDPGGHWPEADEYAQTVIAMLAAATPPGEAG